MFFPGRRGAASMSAVRKLVTAAPLVASRCAVTDQLAVA
jgi:hypothetical protein